MPVFRSRVPQCAPRPCFLFVLLLSPLCCSSLYPGPCASPCLSPCSQFCLATFWSFSFRFCPPCSAPGCLLFALFGAFPCALLLCRFSALPPRSLAACLFARVACLSARATVYLRVTFLFCRTAFASLACPVSPVSGRPLPSTLSAFLSYSVSPARRRSETF